MNITWADAPPTPQAYIDLRAATGLGPQRVEEADIGRQHGLFCITVYDDTTQIGMGWIIGDGGCVVDLVDVVVHPNAQGAGKQMIDKCVTWAKATLPESCLITLISSPKPASPYATRGFEQEIGMMRRV